MKKTITIILSVAALLVVVAGVFFYFQFSKYRDAGLESLQTRLKPEVSITSPQTFSQASVRAPLMVKFAAGGFAPLSVVELWVNGKHMGTQDAQRQTSLDGIFLWNPGAAGKFSLVTRVTDQNGETADSSPVWVDIAPVSGPDAGPDPAKFLLNPALVFPAAGSVPGSGANPGVSGPIPPAAGPQGGAEPPAPPAPGQPIPPAGTGGLTVVDYFTHFTNNTPPAAPALAASTAACQVNLQIHDLSNNEEGFQVYRSLNGGPGWNKIAALNSQPVSGWISYADRLGGNTFASYYVAAVNTIGRSESNLVSVTIDPAQCPVAKGQQRAMVVELTHFDISGPIDQPYCYRSTDNVSWQRWPATGFLPQGSQTLNGQDSRLLLDLTSLDGGSKVTRLDLTLECWGWAGDQVKYLGKVHYANPDLTRTGPMEFHDGDLSVGLNLSDFPTHFLPPPCPPGFPCNSGPGIPTLDQIPYLAAWLSYNPNDCWNHLPAYEEASADHSFAGVYCSTFPNPDSYGQPTPGSKPAYPQPFLLWSVTSSCPAGKGSQCMSAADIQSLMQSSGGSAYFQVMKLDEQHMTAVDVPLDTTVYRAPMQNCMSDLHAYVSIAFSSQGWGTQPWQNGAPWSGWDSNTVTIPCTLPIKNTVKVKVSFDSMTLAAVKDGESEPQDVELYGFFMAGARSLTLGRWDSSVRNHMDCPNDNWSPSFQTSGIAYDPTSGCLDFYFNGTTQLANQGLCSDSMVPQCIDPDTHQWNAWRTNNNSVTVNVADFSVIPIIVDTVDYDSLSADDQVCMGVTTIGPKSLADWALMGPTTIHVKNPDLGSGSCDVKVTLSVVPDYAK